MSDRIVLYIKSRSRINSVVTSINNNGSGDLSDKLVYLAFRSDTVSSDMQEHLVCKSCHNRTWILFYDIPDSGPELRCAFCRENAGRIGWWQKP
jgi:hypothetical protein